MRVVVVTSVLVVHVRVPICVLVDGYGVALSHGPNSGRFSRWKLCLRLFARSSFNQAWFREVAPLG